MDKNLLVKHIEEKYPSFRKKDFNTDDYGWANYVLVVDNKVIFRFPRDEESKKSLYLEQKVLPNLKYKLSVPIPEFIYSSTDEEKFTYVGYEIIDGKPLDSEGFKLLKEEEKECFAEDISKFLSELHTFSFQTYFPNKIDMEEAKGNWRELLKEINEFVFPLLNEKERAWTTELFNNFLREDNNFNYNQCLIHGDLGSDHILYDYEKRKISGIIDFGDIQIGDPAYDFIGLYICYGADFTEKVFSKYTAQKDENFMDRIEKFYVKRTPFYGIIHGVKTNNLKLQEECLAWLRTMI